MPLLRQKKNAQKFTDLFVYSVYCPLTSLFADCLVPGVNYYGLVINMFFLLTAQ